MRSLIRLRSMVFCLCAEAPVRLVALLLAAAAVPHAPAGAQGVVIPRSCGPEQACRPPRPCRPEQDCAPWGAWVERVRSDVRVSLANRVLSYEITETFVNRGNRIGEADYLFPLPRGAAFQDLRLEIDGKLVSGETLGADEARRIYEEIVRRQRDPALVEWMGTGLLRTRIFPILPGERKSVVVRLQMVAEREGDALRVDYARGTPPTRAQVADGRVRPAPAGRSSFVLRYAAGERLGTPYSPTHALDISEEGGARTVRVTGDARDVTLLLPLRRASDAAISMLAHAPDEADGFALITLSPPPVSGSRTPRDVTFVVDVSGSMSGAKIEQARAAGRQLLATLDARDRFRIIDFSTDVRTFRAGFVFATAANVRAGVRYLNALEAEGSTNIAGALRAALEQADGVPERREWAPEGGDGSDETALVLSPDTRSPSRLGRLPLVLFVTDGEPTVGERDPGAIAAAAARSRGRARIFTFGLGSDVNVTLVEQLALEGRGTAHFVKPGESVERAVSVVASRLAMPVVTDLTVRVDCTDSEVCVRLSRVMPGQPIDLFAGQDAVVLSRYSGGGAATLRFTGESVRGPVRWSQRVSFPSRSRSNAFVARLWATRRVGWLSAEKRRNGGSSEVDSEIRELGERYGIPTEFTSYFVREPGMVVTGDLRRGDRGAGVAIGGGAAPASAPPAALMRERAFKEASASQSQRDAVSLSAADALDTPADPAHAAGAVATRRAGGRVFARRNNAWVDNGHRADARTVRVRAYSDAYFALVARIPELGPMLALGDRVIVAGRTLSIEVTPDGAETLGGAELASIAAGW